MMPGYEMVALALFLLGADAQTPPAPAAAAAAKPCADPQYRQLDFWVGQWDVRPARPGAKPFVASSTITSLHGGCVVFEDWKGPGSTGSSFNIYDRARGRWFQTWVDSSGGRLSFAGSLESGNMVYHGEAASGAAGEASRARTRMTFFNLGPNEVRQLVERSSDEGKTWQAQIDLIYTRRPS